MGLRQWWRDVRGIDDSPRPIDRMTIYKLFKRWDSEEAKYYYELRKATKAVNYDGTSYIESSPYSWDELSKEGWRRVSDGDLAWAKKNARHHDITLPTKAYKPKLED
jgi:hypothetical protein